MASQARDGIDGTKEQFQSKEAEVQEVEREISTIEKAAQAVQREVDELTQKHAQLDIDIKEFQSNERSSESDKVCFAKWTCFSCKLCCTLRSCKSALGCCCCFCCSFLLYMEPRHAAMWMYAGYNSAGDREAREPGKAVSTKAAGCSHRAR